MEDDLTYAATALDRSVVAPDQIRTVLRAIRQKLFTEIFPGRTEIPKLLFFAKSDSHAEDILRILRQEWSLSNEQAVKITYKAELDGDGKVAPSRRPEQLIKDFANAYNPRVAVTVDMIATGTDIKPLEGVIFLRMVRSRALFEQMKGRAVRVMPDADFQAISPDGGSKSEFVVIDCVGVMEAVKADPPLDGDPSVPFAKLLELVRMGNRDEDVLSALASRLDRMERRLTADQKAQLAQVPGAPPLRDLVAHVLDRLDPDQEEQRARELFAVPAMEVPTENQRQQARTQLLDEAAQPLASNPQLCQALLTVRQAQEITVDVLTADKLTFAGARPDQNLNYESAAENLTSEFEAYCRENRDQLDAPECAVCQALPAADHAGEADGAGPGNPAATAPVDHRSAVAGLRAGGDQPGEGRQQGQTPHGSDLPGPPCAGGGGGAGELPGPGGRALRRLVGAAGQPGPDLQRGAAGLAGADPRSDRGGPGGENGRSR